jgi:hypothetical protein
MKSKINYWKTTIIILLVIAIGIILLEKVVHKVWLINIGLFLFASISLLIGFEAIVKRKIVLQSRYSRRLNETYIGIAAIAQGITLLILGMFLAFIDYLDLTNTGQSAFECVIKRPGIILIIIGIYVLSYSLIAFLGYKEQNETSRFVYYLDLFASRLLPGIILLVWGLGFMILGFIDVFNPTYFDSIGGGFLEVLFFKK